MCPVLTSHIHWLVPLSDEQLRALPGSRQGFTAQMADGRPRDLFSVSIVFPDNVTDGGEREVELALLAPDCLPDVVGRLTPGCHLRIFRGPRTVAECVVIAVGQSAAAPGAL
jgi:hypothetical protein